jgi:hypothetical protein
LKRRFHIRCLCACGHCACPVIWAWGLVSGRLVWRAFCGRLPQLYRRCRGYGRSHDRSHGRSLGPVGAVLKGGVRPCRRVAGSRGGGGGGLRLAEGGVGRRRHGSGFGVAGGGGLRTGVVVTCKGAFIGTVYLLFGACVLPQQFIYCVAPTDGSWGSGATALLYGSGRHGRGLLRCFLRACRCCCCR